MTDIVERLRSLSEGRIPLAWSGWVLEAADQIEGLRDEIRNAYRERDEASQDWEQAMRRVTELEQQLETERMRLAVCGVVALANTPGSAIEAREMRPEYWSASCGDVARAVDREMEHRDRVKALEQQLASRAVPDGWRLVPVEPTMDMLCAAREADTEYQRRMGLPDTVGVGAYDHYVAMLAAAPQPDRGNPITEPATPAEDIDQTALDLAKKVWAIGNRHGPDTQRKAEIQVALADSLRALAQLGAVPVCEPRKKKPGETPTETLCRRLEEYIEYASNTKRFADVGFYQELIEALTATGGTE